MKKIPFITKVILIILFLGCLLDWEYGYYQLVRFLGMVGFTILAFHDFDKNKTWFYIWVFSAILINPIFKIALGRTIWNVVDVLWAILLLLSIVVNQKKNKEIS